MPLASPISTFESIRSLSTFPWLDSKEYLKRPSSLVGTLEACPCIFWRDFLATETSFHSAPSFLYTISASALKRASKSASYNSIVTSYSKTFPSCRLSSISSSSNWDKDTNSQPPLKRSPIVWPSKSALICSVSGMLPPHPSTGSRIVEVTSRYMTHLPSKRNRVFLMCLTSCLPGFVYQVGEVTGRCLDTLS